MTTSLVGKRLGNYDIQAKIGEGGMGAVYMGLHPGIGKKVAIKVLHEELCSKSDVVTRFFNEAKAVNDISHPNIVDIIDFGDTTFDGEICKYIIMELLDGESLSARMRREGVTIRESLQIIAQTASALAASHGKGVIHRDLKPENVFLCTRQGDRNYVKLLDFGIAKLTSETGQAMSQKTRTGMVIGTPTYMSPEQCDGKGDIDARADIYSLGVMMYELLTGRVPFPGDGFGEVLVAHLTREPDPPRGINPNIPPELEAIILRCMRKVKSQRFQSMNDLIAALNDPGPHYQSFVQGLAAPTAGSGPAMPGGAPMLPNPMATGAMSAMSGGGMMGPGGSPMNPGPAQQMRSPSAVWSVVNPNMAPGMQQMAPMPMMQSGPAAMMPQMGMMPGGVRMPTGMMIAPGMMPDMLPVPGAVAGPRPTTLSGASAEQSGRRRPLNVLIGFVGAMVIGALVVVGARVTSGRNATATTVRPSGSMVSIVIKSDPPEAEVYRSDDDSETGKTPYTFQVKKGGKPIDVKVRLSGYREESRTFSVNSDQAVDLKLVKEEQAPTEAPPTPASETTSKPHRIRDKVKESEPVAVKEPKEAKEPRAVKAPKVDEVKAPKAEKVSAPKAEKVSAPKDSTPKDGAADKPKKKKKGDGDSMMRPIF